MTLVGLPLSAMSKRSLDPSRVWASGRRGARDFVASLNRVSPAGRTFGAFCLLLVLLVTFYIGHGFGRREGYGLGYQSGYDDGEQSGIEAGRAEGIELGRVEGYKSGYAAGRTDGLDEGRSGGEAEGYEKGYDVGYRDGRDCAVLTPSYLSVYTWCNPPTQLFTFP